MKIDESSREQKLEACQYLRAYKLCYVMSTWCNTCDTNTTVNHKNITICIITTLLHANQLNHILVYLRFTHRKSNESSVFIVLCFFLSGVFAGLVIYVTTICIFIYSSYCDHAKLLNSCFPVCLPSHTVLHGCI